jgi:hypothetical protein
MLPVTPVVAWSRTTKNKSGSKIIDQIYNFDIKLKPELLLGS